MTLAAKYHSEIQSIMFTCGEIRNAVPETTLLIEDILRLEIQDLARQVERSAKRRGSRQMTPEDLFFTIRGNQAHFSKFTRFATWKHVHKLAKDVAENNLDECVEEELYLEKLPDALDERAPLPWDFIEQLESLSGVKLVTENAVKPSAQLRRRLKYADELSSSMTEEEYAEFAECRKTSFTARKFPRFRELCDLTRKLDIKPTNELLEVLGAFAHDLVRDLTELALQLKAQLGFENEAEAHESHVSPYQQELKAQSLFAMENDEHPIQPWHVQEAYRRLQRESVRKSAPKTVVAPLLTGMFARGQHGLFRRPLP